MQAMSNAFASLLFLLNACGPARDWAANMTAREAWETCPRGDWLLWLAARLLIPRVPLLLAACACARPTLVAEGHPVVAIETAEAWARGGPGAPTLDDVRAAARASRCTADHRAAYVAYANAAYVADAAAYVAQVADAARDASRAATAEIVRAMISWETIEAAIERRAA